jgi:pilus assembly protein Flp/PilA
MIKFIRNLKKNTSGASAAEYALITAVLGGFVVAGATAFGGGLTGAFNTAGTDLTRQTVDADTVRTPAAAQ